MVPATGPGNFDVAVATATTRFGLAQGGAVMRNHVDVASSYLNEEPIEPSCNPAVAGAFPATRRQNGSPDLR